MRFGCLLVFVCLFSAVPILAQGGNSSQLPPPVLDTDYYGGGSPSHEKIELERLLFFDKILSGNQNICCATCHHPVAATGDGLSLPIGEGADGLGVTRDTGTGLAAVHERIPRNALHIFNSGPGNSEGCSTTAGSKFSQASLRPRGCTG